MLLNMLLEAQCSNTTDLISFIDAELQCLETVMFNISEDSTYESLRSPYGLEYTDLHNCDYSMLLTAMKAIILDEDHAIEETIKWEIETLVSKILVIESDQLETLSAITLELKEWLPGLGDRISDIIIRIINRVTYLPIQAYSPSDWELIEVRNSNEENGLTKFMKLIDGKLAWKPMVFGLEKSDKSPVTLEIMCMERHRRHRRMYRVNQQDRYIFITDSIIGIDALSGEFIRMDNGGAALLRWVYRFPHVASDLYIPIEIAAAGEHMDKRNEMQLTPEQNLILVNCFRQLQETVIPTGFSNSKTTAMPPDILTEMLECSIDELETRNHKTGLSVLFDSSDIFMSYMTALAEAAPQFDVRKLGCDCGVPEGSPTYGLDQYTNSIEALSFFTERFVKAMENSRPPMDSE